MIVEVSGLHFRTGRPVRLRLERGRIAGVKPLRGSGKGLPWIGPGLVDLQVNGFRGIDFNGDSLPEGTVSRIAGELCREGTTTFFPTVITRAPEAIEAALRAIARDCAADPRAREAVPGLHLEGPFICPEDGPRGAHDRAHVRPPDGDLLDRWRRASEGRLRILTMSPEWPGAAAFIARCAGAGLLVAIGHTAATPTQIQEAVSAGARLCTHFGNGSHLQLPRHPNYLWEQLAADPLWASLIADGFHLPDSVIKVVLLAKGRKAILVSDSVFLGGMEPGTYDTAVGGRVVLTGLGKLHLEGNPGLLAGSSMPLVRGVERLVTSGLCGFAEAWERASVLPAELLGLPQAKGLDRGAPADVVVFGWDGERVDIRRVYRKGRPVYEAEPPPES